MRRALLLSTALLLTACGGEQEADPKVAYVEQATEVCEQAEAEFRELTVPTTPEGFAPYADQLVGILEDASTQLTTLTPPPEDEEELEERVFQPLAEAVQDARAYAVDVRAAGTDQAALLELLSERPTAEGVDTEYLRSYGLPTCADAIELAG